MFYIHVCLVHVKVKVVRRKEIRRSHVQRIINALHKRNVASAGTVQVIKHGASYVVHFRSLLIHVIQPIWMLIIDFVGQVNQQLEIIMEIDAVV
jgi:hypothetical protein